MNSPFQDDIDALEQADINLHSNITNLYSEVDTVQVSTYQIDPFHKSCKYFWKETKSFQISVSTLYSEVDSVQSSVSTLYTEIDSVQSSVSTLYSEVDRVEVSSSWTLASKYVPLKHLFFCVCRVTLVPCILTLSPLILLFKKMSLT